MLLTNSDEEVCVWDSVDGHLLYHFYKSDLLSTSAVSFSPNDNNVIICYDNKVKNWNLENDTINNLRDPNLSFAHKDTVRSAFYSFDNSKIITAADDYKLKIWDAKSFKLLQTIEGVSNVIFSPDGKKYIRKYMYYIELYDFNSGKLICGFSNLSSSISYVSFLVNGDYIVTEADNTIRVWDTITGKMVDYYEHDDYITGITCNPKENRIAFTLKGKTIKTISFPYLKTLYDENKMRFGSRQFTREEREKYYLD
jgi:WD40 repeat protein